MNVGQVRPQDVTNKPVLIQRPDKDAGRPGLLSGVDEARLSESARQALREADRHAARLRAPDAERQTLVAAARAKLQRGELDDLRALHATARRLLQQQSDQV